VIAHKPNVAISTGVDGIKPTYALCGGKVAVYHLESLAQFGLRSAQMDTTLNWNAFVI